MRTVLFLPLILLIGMTSLSNSAFAETSGSESCETELLTTPVTEVGTFHTAKIAGRPHAVIIESHEYPHGEEQLILDMKDGQPVVQVLKSSLKQAASQYLVYHVDAIGDMNRPNVTTEIKDGTRRKVDLSGQVYLVFHPNYGLIAIDESGVVIKLPSDIQTIAAHDVKAVINFNSFDTSIQLAIVTKSNDAYLLSLRMDPVGWPIFHSLHAIVDSIDGKDKDIASYQFVEMTKFGIHRFRYQRLDDQPIARYLMVDGEGAKFDNELVDEFAESQNNGTQRNNFIKLQDGQPKYLFTFDEGIGIWDESTGKLTKKYLGFDRAIPVKMEVEALFDLREIGFVGLITRSGHLRLIDRNELLDPSKDTFDFVNRQPGRMEQGPFHGLSSFGWIVRQWTPDQSGPSGVVRMYILKSDKDHRINSSMIFREAILVVNPDGTFKLLDWVLPYFKLAPPGPDRGQN